MEPVSFQAASFTFSSEPLAERALKRRGPSERPGFEGPDEFFFLNKICIFLMFCFLVGGIGRV